MQRKTDGVRASALDETDVLACYVIVLKLLPERCRVFFADKFLEHAVNHRCGVRLRESEHIPFGIQPVSEVRPLDEEFGTIGLHDVFSLNLEKSSLCECGLCVKDE